MHAVRAAERGGQLGHFALSPTLLMAPKRSIYPNRTVKYSIKVVSTYICPGPLKISLLPRMQLLNNYVNFNKSLKSREQFLSVIYMARYLQMQSALSPYYFQGTNEMHELAIAIYTYMTMHECMHVATMFTIVKIASYNLIKAFSRPSVIPTLYIYI